MKRFDKGYFRYSFASSLRTILILLLFFVGNMWDDEELRPEDLFAAIPFFIGGAVVIYLALMVYAWLYWRMSGYTLTEDDLRCKRGVLFRKSSVLPYLKVHAINKQQGLIQRLFGIATLTVDSGSTTNAFSAEIIIIEKSAEIDRLIAEIKCRQEGKPVTDTAVEESVRQTDSRENLYVFHSRLKVMYAVLSLCGTVLAILALGILAAIGLSISALILRATPDFSFMEWLLGATFFTVLAMILLGILSLICGLLASFTSYHHFTIYKSAHDIEISYGLFVRHTNNFHFKRIKAVKITDGPIKRLFGFAAATLEVVGYGAESGNDDENSPAASGMLLPLCRRKDIEDTINTILPGYRPDPITHRAKSYPAFILWTLFGMTATFTSVFAAVLTILLLVRVPAAAVSYTALGFAAALLLSILCVMLFSLFAYRQAGLTVGEDKLTLQCGTIVRTRTVIRRKDLIAIERITTPLRQKRDIYTYKIHFFANALTNTVTVKNLDAGLAEELEALLRY